MSRPPKGRILFSDKASIGGLFYTSIFQKDSKKVHVSGRYILSKKDQMDPITFPSLLDADGGMFRELARPEFNKPDGVFSIAGVVRFTFRNNGLPGDKIWAGAEFGVPKPKGEKHLVLGGSPFPAVNYPPKAQRSLFHLKDGGRAFPIFRLDHLIFPPLGIKAVEENGCFRLIAFYPEGKLETEAPQKEKGANHYSGYGEKNDHRFSCFHIESFLNQFLFSFLLLFLKLIKPLVSTPANDYFIFSIIENRRKEKDIGHESHYIILFSIMKQKRYSLRGSLKELIS